MDFLDALLSLSDAFHHSKNRWILLAEILQLLREYLGHYFHIKHLNGFDEGHSMLQGNLVLIPALIDTPESLQYIFCILI